MNRKDGLKELFQHNLEIEYLLQNYVGLKALWAKN